MASYSVQVELKSLDMSDCKLQMVTSELDTIVKKEATGSLKRNWFEESLHDTTELVMQVFPKESSGVGSLIMWVLTFIVTIKS